jgi:hypothetical protein
MRGISAAVRGDYPKTKLVRRCIEYSDRDVTSWGRMKLMKDMVMIAYNLISLFRQLVLKEKQQSALTTIRFKCFAFF